METWIRKACRKRAYRQLWTWIILTISGLLIAASFQTYWNNFFKGPFEISRYQLETMTQPDGDQQFVSVTGSKEVPSGVDVITTESRNGQKTSEYVSSHYYVLVAGDRLLVVQAEKEPPLHIEGQLKYLAPNILDLMVPDKQDADFRSRFYPLMLDTTDSYRLPGWIFFGCLLVWCFLLWKFALPAWNSTKEITNHSVVKRIESWSNASEIADLAQQQRSTAKLKGRGLTITEDFVVEHTFYRFDLFLWNDLLWAYEKITTRTIYLVLPISRTSQAILVFYGGSVNIPAKKTRVAEILQMAARRSPWAVFGYTPELANSFKKTTSDFCAAVDARHQQMRETVDSIIDEPDPPQRVSEIEQNWPE
jgi:hypothetical protein